VPHWYVATAPAAPRTPVERRVRRRERLAVVKAVTGITLLVVVGGLATAAAVHTIAGIASSDTTTRLERYVDGKNVLRVAKSDGRFVASFPNQPTETAPTEHLFVPLSAHRYISTLHGSHDTVELEWFDLSSKLRILDPQSVLGALSLALTNELRGTLSSGRAVAGATPPAYEFVVDPQQGSQSETYRVRAILDDHRVYVLRVQSNDAKVGPRALAALVASFRILPSRT
jgi:hypothetical protein